MKLQIITALLALGSVTAVGNYLSRQEFVTAPAAVLQFYVQPDGGVDAPICSVTAPCRTLQYTWDTMIPANIRGGTSVTVWLADGVYDETNLRLGGKRLYQSNNLLPTLALQGSTTMARATVATGSTTVTQTAYAAASGITPATVTDSSGTWTASDLKGKYLTSTSGATNGQRRIISGNTGTTITLVQGFTASPANGATFTIDYPGAKFTKAVNISGVAGLNASSGMTMARIAFVPTSSVALQVLSSDALRNMTDIAVNGSVGGSGGLQITNCGAQIALSNVSVIGGSNSALSLSQCIGNGGNTATGTGLYAKISSPTNAAILLSSCGLFGGSITAEQGDVSGPVITVSGTSSFTTSTAPAPLSRFICLGSTNSIGWNLTSVSGYSYATGTLGTLSFESCATGAMVWGRSTVDLSGATVTISNATNGVYAKQGGKVFLGTGATITYSTVTNQTVTDGVVLTQAAIDALTPKRQCATDGTCISRE
jgi:hypothetical protein